MMILIFFIMVFYNYVKRKSRSDICIRVKTPLEIDNSNWKYIGEQWTKPEKEQKWWMNDIAENITENFR